MPAAYVEPEGFFSDDAITEVIPDMEARVRELDAEAARYKCCSPRCPGFPYKASEWAHPPDVCPDGHSE